MKLSSGTLLVLVAAFAAGTPFPAAAEFVLQPAPRPVEVTEPVDTSGDRLVGEAAPVAVSPKGVQDEASAAMPIVEATVVTREPVAQPPVTYEVFAGEKLSVAFERWAAAARWTLLWKTEFSYVVEVSHRFDGLSFEQAVELAIRSFEVRSGEKRLRVRGFGGNKTLIVEGAGK